jgi:hypothetical protein
MVRITIPKTFMGVPVSKETLEKVLAGNSTPVTRDDNPSQVTPTNGWLYVPSIGMEFSPDLDGLGTNWYDSHKLAKSKGLIMPSPEETWALIFEAKAHLDKPEFRKLYEFFTRKTPKNTWHSEWQDAFFKEENGKMFKSRFKGLNAKGEPEFDNPVDITRTYLTSDGYANVSQKSNITAQGLCNVADSRTNYVEGENFYFWYPRNGAVARFIANSDRAYLYCSRNPTSTDAGLGVRLARRVAPSTVGKKQRKK